MSSDRDQLAAVREQLTGAPHFWDRPDGDFGPLPAAYGLERSKRERARSGRRRSPAERGAALDRVDGSDGTVLWAALPGLSVLMLRQPHER
ncbi:hypothetical protein ACIQU4_18160 [Streptomyces sp. NPDC090741]|uniref:hypothetical protein n=1 Tax=Streptomyces sp. NPDC090741 TaxID=3365967 RepID=UPI00380CFB06